MKFSSLKVGEWYLRKDGAYVQVKDKIEGQPTFIAAGRLYLPNGESYPGDHDLDIVELVTLEVLHEREAS